MEDEEIIVETEEEEDDEVDEDGGRGDPFVVYTRSNSLRKWVITEGESCSNSSGN